jgi:hypothetical protein
MFLHLAADKGFVALDRDRAAADLARHIGHGDADAVKHEPSRFLGHTQSAVEFIAADAILAIREHPSGGKPLL